jgi:hypothetical protein
MKQSALLLIYIISLPINFSYSDNGINSIHPNATTTFFPFLKIGYEARSVAMGGVCASIPNEIYGVMGNPAAVGHVDKMQAMISYKPVVLDIKGGTMAFAMPYKSTGTWAVNIIYLSHGDYQPVDENNKIIEGMLNPYSVAGSITWSKTLIRSLSLGATFKGIYERLSGGIEDEYGKCSADGVAADIGVQYRTRSSRVIYGLLIRNIGYIRSSYSDDVQRTGFPISFTTGISYHSPAMIAAFDLEKAVDDILQYKVGLEFNIYKQNIFLRAGSSASQTDIKKFFDLLKSGTDEDNDYQKTNWSLFSVGGGLKAELNDLDINVDTAFSFRIDRLPFAFALTFLIGF